MPTEKEATPYVINVSKSDSARDAGVSDISIPDSFKEDLLTAKNNLDKSSSLEEKEKIVEELLAEWKKKSREIAKIGSPDLGEPLPEVYLAKTKEKRRQEMRRINEMLKAEHETPISQTSNTGGLETATKYDEGKVDLTIIPTAAQEEIAKVFTFGAKKYERTNFAKGKGLLYTRILASLLRHIYAFMKGEDLDPETGLSHIAHAGANVCMLLHYISKKETFDNDDRNVIL